MNMYEKCFTEISVSDSHGRVPMSPLTPALLLQELHNHLCKATEKLRAQARASQGRLLLPWHCPGWALGIPRAQWWMNELMRSDMLYTHTASMFLLVEESFLTWLALSSSELPICFEKKEWTGRQQGGSSINKRDICIIFPGVVQLFEDQD